MKIEKRLGVEALASVMLIFESDCIEEYDELVVAFYKRKHLSEPKKLELVMKNRESPPARTSVEESLS